MKAMKFILPALLPVALAIACNGRAYNKEASALSRADTSAAVGIADEQADPKTDASPKQKGTTVNAHSPFVANPDWDKKIVKTADLEIEVKNFRSFTDALHEKVRAAGGYIAKEAQNESPYKIENVVTIKVPVDRFDEAVMQLASDSDKLVGKKISTEDVTMQLVDTKSRLEAKKEVRDRYLDLLKQAHSMKDILQVQNEINDIQADIEGAAGRIAYLGHAAAYSTINLDFYQVLDATVKDTTEPSFLHKLKESFKEGWGWMSALVIGLVGLWPLLLAGLLAVIGWRRRKVKIKAGVM